MNANTNNSGGGYWLGSIVEVRCQFSQIDVDGVETVVDPASVRCTFTPPSGDATTYIYGTAAADNADRIIDADDEPWYYFRYTPLVAGDGRYKILATGTGAAALTVRYSVRAD